MPNKMKSEMLAFFTRILAVAVWLTLAATIDAAVSFRTVVLTDAPAPGHPTGEHFTNFDAPVLNSQGEVAFRAYHSPAMPFSNIGIWSEGGGTGLRLVARDGEEVSLHSGIDVFNNFGRPFLNDNGVVAFDAVAGSLCRDCGIPLIIIEDDSHGLNVVAQVDGPAPMTNDQARFESMGLDGFNNAGEAVFEASLLASSGRAAGVWITNARQEARMVAREGYQAPGLPLGSTIENINNHAGQYVLPLTDSGRTSFMTNYFEAAWVGSSYGDLQRVIAEGDSVPGVGTLAHFNDIYHPIVSNDGDVTFHGGFDGVGIALRENNAIFRGNQADGFRIVAQAGDTAVGFPTGMIFYQFELRAANNEGDTVFDGHATTNTPGDPLVGGLWLDDHEDGLQLVAKAGTLLPGLKPDEKLSGFRGGFPLLNDLGEVLFRGDVVGPGVNETNNGAIWLRDQDEVIELILREGQNIDVDSGPGVDFRTIAEIGFVDQRAFNNRGQFAFQAAFRDGTQGVFVVTRAVPEPGSCVLLMLSLIWTFRQRTSMDLTWHTAFWGAGIA